MGCLHLAVEIADALAEATENQAAIDVDRMSASLHASHPEADATRREIAEVLAEHAGEDFPAEEA